jgi:4-hydroxybenzoate polyprenyltransferase
MENYISILKEFLSFIRIETCLFISGISVAGYAMFNKIDYSLLFLFLAIFLCSGASYGYNYLTDRKEDRINNKRLNYFVMKSREGKLAVIMLFVSGFLSSLRLPLPSFVVYLMLIVLGAVYSGLRIKGMFIVKNVFTGATISLAFIVGASISGSLDAQAFSYLPFIFLFGLILNILGDIRGHEGDAAAKVKTIPVIFGSNAAKKVVYSMTLLFAVCAIIFSRVLLYPLIPFMLMISFFLHRGDHRKSRLSVLSSFIFFSCFMLLFNLSGGV